MHIDQFGIGSSNLAGVIPPIGRLSKRFDISIYVVGGAVRDLLLNRSVSDLDLLVDGDVANASLWMSEEFAGKRIILDHERQIHRVILGEGYEIHHIDISKMKDSIEADLWDRDFTIDAMAFSFTDIFEGWPPNVLIDPCGGLADIKNRKIRPVKKNVFLQDPCRMIRAVRLAQQLDFVLSNECAELIKSQHLKISLVAQERVRDELLEILSGSQAQASLQLMDGLGLLCVIIPELKLSKGVTQPNEHYWDVFTHLIQTVGKLELILCRNDSKSDSVLNELQSFAFMKEYFEDSIGDGYDRRVLLKLAGLLHDIGKPVTKTVEDNGRIRFLGHNLEGENLAENVMKRLRFSNKSISHVKMLIRHHLRPTQMSSKHDMPSRRAIYRYRRDVGSVAADVLFLNLADYLAARGPMLEQSQWAGHCKLIQYILLERNHENIPEKVAKLVTGRDIMYEFDLESGPIVGNLLNIVDESYGSGDISTKEEALELLKGHLKVGGSGAKKR